MRSASYTPQQLKYQLQLSTQLFSPPTQPPLTMTTDAALSVESAMQLRFPPFPQAPDGVELLPFHLFRPSGIRVPIDDDDDEYQRALGDEVERDGLGIITVPLRVKHVMDTQEKKKKRKKKVNGAPQVQVAPEKPKTWWEVWEELEEIRRNAYDASVPPPPYCVLRSVL